MYSSIHKGSIIPWSASKVILQFGSKEVTKMNHVRRGYNETGAHLYNVQPVLSHDSMETHPVEACEEDEPRGGAAHPVAQGQ